MASGIDIASRARAEMQEIGGKCGNNNKYTHWYSDNVDNIGYNFWWCAAFVSYVVRQCGVPTSVVPNFAYCPDCIDWARSKGRLHSKSQIAGGSYTPKAGDIFLREGHTGIIVSVSGSQFTTVEGNTGGTSNCRTVGSHTWSFSGGNYDYVFNPDYPDKSDGRISSSGNVESYMYSENSYGDGEKEPTAVWNNRSKENIHARMANGARILISFANGNTSNYMTLNVNNTGAYFVWFPIGSNRAYNNELISKFIVDGCVYEFVYQDGSTPKWVYCGAASILINDETPTYIEASNRENLSSGEKLSMAFGKIKKWFSDLKAVAFSNDYNDLDNKPTALKNPNSLTLTMNGSSSSYNGASSASKSWYAPTTAGTAGYELVSNGSGAPVWKAQNYAECTTAGTTAVKTVSITNFKLIKGARVTVKFAKEHSLASSAAQLNVSNTGAKPILYYGNPVYGRYESRIDYAVPINTWNAGKADL